MQRAFISALFLLLFFSAPSWAFTLSNFETPESMVIDPEDGSYYVSNINGEPAAKDGNGYISKISPDGNTVIQKFAGSRKEEMILHAPKGLAVIGENIFVSDIDSVKGFNKITGKPSVLIDMSSFNVKFLNDLAYDGKGILYVSDTMTNQIFRIDMNKDYEVTLFKESSLLAGPNGLLVNPKTKNLMVATWVSGQILEIDRMGGIHVLKNGFQTLDGMDFDNQGNLFVSSFDKGEVFKITRMGRGAVSTSLPGLNSPADISYSKTKDELLVPSFKGNTVSTVSTRA